MSSHQFDIGASLREACGAPIAIFTQLGDDTYSFEDAGGISLLDRETLVEKLNQFGGRSKKHGELEGGPVG